MPSKYYDNTRFNNLIFAKGNIQTSPTFLQKLNEAAPVPYRPYNSSTVPTTGYQVFLTGYANYILNLERNSHEAIQLHNDLNRLRSIPRPMQDGYLLKGSIDTRKVESPYYSIWYKVGNGQILIINIEPTKALSSARRNSEKTGIYKVSKKENGEYISSKVNSVETPYAAVNGQSNDLDKARWLMAQHLEFEYGEAASNEYTLFHNPSRGGTLDTWESIQDKVGFTTQVTKDFSKLLVETQKSGKDVKWIAHSQGGLIFTEGVRYFLNGNSSWALLGGFNGAFKDKSKISLNHHSVAFHGNANNNKRSKPLFDRAGITVNAIRGNDNDFVYNIIGANAKNSWNVIGSLAYLPHVFNGTVQQSPHTQMQTQAQWAENMSNGPGAGRNMLQRGFEKASVTIPTIMQYIPNFMK